MFFFYNREVVQLPYYRKKACNPSLYCPDGRLSNPYTPRGKPHFRQSYKVFKT